ncbi:MAG: hypothetical protein H6548_01150 [Chitinophagales bacterium]|nr:hypothetical protein [Chitinophagales bacterium]MCB9020704.1 hypothetical protein [Chitinophagales bacterium]MCB9031377.1 hypothetical protein [Chitinophagales bacterium]HPE96737.1 hypothetical protein [Chitinophagales bacterium]HPR28189.1 hypothetical protein [Chitinophagales bacterium]
MKKQYAILALALAMPILSQAQSDEDALRYSMLGFGGTARSLGVANAFGALGGDFSSLAMNPAGIGIYRSSEFVFTPGLTHFDNQSAFYGSATNADKYNFNLSNLGMVFTNMKTGKANADNGWVATQFAVGYNRLENFNNRLIYTGFNDRNSLTSLYVEQLNANGGTNPGSVTGSFPFGAGLAWETYLINPNFNDSTSYYTEIQGGNIQQTKTLETSGAYDELDFSFGGNYGNKLYVGFTLGVPIVDYNAVVTYTEEDVQNVHDNFNQMTLTDQLNVNGAGINGKFGVIYRVNDYLRLGGAVHTPTALGLTDVYRSTMTSSLDTSGSYGYDSPTGRYEYSIVTPWRAIASAAITMKQYGFISFDYEFVDYSAAGFNFNRIGSVDDITLETALNNTINEKYTGAHNIRVGAELAYEVFRFRGGYAIMGTPFASGFAEGSADFARSTYTLGAGIRDEHFYVDLGYANTRSTEYDTQYNFSDGNGANEGATIDKTVSNFLLSLGFRF